MYLREEDHEKLTLVSTLDAFYVVQPRFSPAKALTHKILSCDMLSLSARPMHPENDAEVLRGEYDLDWKASYNQACAFLSICL